MIDFPLIRPAPRIHVIMTKKYSSRTAATKLVDAVRTRVVTVWEEKGDLELESFLLSLRNENTRQLSRTVGGPFNPTSAPTSPASQRVGLFEAEDPYPATQFAAGSGNHRIEIS